LLYDAALVEVPPRVNAVLNAEEARVAACLRGRAFGRAGDVVEVIGGGDAEGVVGGGVGEGWGEGLEGVSAGWICVLVVDVFLERNGRRALR